VWHFVQFRRHLWRSAVLIPTSTKTTFGSRSRFDQVLQKILKHTKKTPTAIFLGLYLCLSVRFTDCTFSTGTFGDFALIPVIRSDESPLLSLLKYRRGFSKQGG